MTSTTQECKKAMRVYATELICSMGVLGFQTFKPMFCNVFARSAFDNGKHEDLSRKKQPARCFLSSHDYSMLWFGGYLLRFHLASDWSQNNKQSRNFLVFTVYGKDRKCLKSRLDV